MRSLIISLLFGLLSALFLDTYAAAPWIVHYYPSPDFSGEPRTGRVRRVIFYWSDATPFADFPRDRFSLRLESCVRLERPKTARFVLSSDDRASLYVDGRLVLAQDRKDGLDSSKLVTLDAGLHHLAVSYVEEEGPALLRLRARTDKVWEDILAPHRLFPPSGTDAGRCVG